MSSTIPLAKPAWTPEQQAGITTTGQSLLLSAAAGSGKTAVLTQRCVYLVCEAPVACEIDELLVVAFNEAAAMEMKSRIQQALRTAYITDPNRRLEKQVALAERASISTLHSFCSRLLRQHFHRIGLDPNFTQLDEDEAGLLRYDVARDLFARRYEADDDGTFQAFIDDYADGDDERLVLQVLRMYSLLTSVIDPVAWRAMAVERLIEATQKPLSDSALGQEFLQLIRNDLQMLSSRIEAGMVLLKPMSHFKLYVDRLNEWQPIIKHWQGLLDTEGLDVFSSEAASIEDIINARLPAMKSGLPGKDVAKSTMDEIKKHLKEGFCRWAGRFTEAGWKKTVERTLAPASTLLSLVDEFESAYATAKSQQRAVDFSDLERNALRVLAVDPTDPKSKPSDVARALQKRYQHVLVDEYQDINEVQDAILRLVSHESVASRSNPSNLFCVGDVKQSIYRFRLAEPRRFLERDALFRSGKANPPGRVIDLQANFRSRAPLLESLNEIFRRLMTKAAAEIEYDQTHELRPMADYYPPPAEGHLTGRPIELHVLPAGLARATSSDPNDDYTDFEQDEYEASVVANRILQLTGRTDRPAVQVYDRKHSGMRPVRLGDIVVLLRSRKFTADRYADVLRKRGVAAHADSGTGFFESQEIRDMMSLLLLLDNQRQDIPLAAVLRSPIGKLPTPEDDLATIRLAYRDPKKPSIPFHQAVHLYADQQDALAAHLRDFLEQMKHWREMMHQRPVADVLRTIYDDAGLLAFYSGLPDGDQRVANLEELYRRSAQFGTFSRQGLSRFLRFMQNLERDSDMGQPSLDAEGSDVVRIMTIHQSKGLEFPIVFLPNLGRRFNLSDTMGSILADRRSYVAMHAVERDRQIRYPSLASVVLRDRIDAQMTAEELRVLYVALTRAREHLILIGSAKETSRDTMQSRWQAHVGPLPAQVVRNAMTPLAWLLPIAATEKAIRRKLFEVTWHDAEAIRQLAASPQTNRVSDGLKPFARLDPLTNVAADPTAADVLARLRFQYPYQVFTTLAAAQSVTSRTKSVADDSPDHDYDTQPSRGEEALDLPRFLAEDVIPKATDLGSFTHTFLQHLDFATAGNAADLDRQKQVMIDRKLLTPSQAKVVNLESIAWLLQSDLGQLIRRHAVKLGRELPVYVPAQVGGATDPADQVMLRGRVDAYLDLPEGGVVIDYKTDRVTGPMLQERIALYTPQILAYADAMADITGRKMSGVYLVFLHPRKMIDVKK